MTHPDHCDLCSDVVSDPGDALCPECLAELYREESCACCGLHQERCVCHRFCCGCGREFDETSLVHHMGGPFCVRCWLDTTSPLDTPAMSRDEIRRLAQTPLVAREPVGLPRRAPPLLVRLVEDTEPMLSCDRDTRGDAAE